MCRWSLIPLKLVKHIIAVNKEWQLSSMMYYLATSTRLLLLKTYLHKHTYLHPSMHSSIHTNLHTSIHPSIHSSVHTNLHTPIHPSIHTYLLTYIPIRNCIVCLCLKLSEMALNKLQEFLSKKYLLQTFKINLETMVFRSPS